MMTGLARLVSLDHLITVAHRGGSGLRPENTIAAFDHGLSLGADAIECDVHLSRDGEVVVIHDPTLDRTTDAAGPVSARAADALARVDAGFHFGSSAGHPYRGLGFGVPRLAQLLSRYRDHPIVIELKGDRPEVAERTVDVLRASDALDRVIIGGFSHGVLATARRLAPALVTSASFEEATAAVTRPDWTAPSPTAFRLFQVPFRLDGRQQFDRRFVDRARGAGMPVQVWVVDEPDQMRMLLEWGVTGLITDRPDRAVEVVRRLL